MKRNLTANEFLAATTTELCEKAHISFIQSTGEICYTFLVDGESIEVVIDTGDLEVLLLHKYFRRPERERVLEEAGYNFNTGRWFY